MLTIDNAADTNNFSAGINKFSCEINNLLRDTYKYSVTIDNTADTTNFPAEINKLSVTINNLSVTINNLSVTINNLLRVIYKKSFAIDNVTTYQQLSGWNQQILLRNQQFIA